MQHWEFTRTRVNSLASCAVPRFTESPTFLLRTPPNYILEESYFILFLIFYFIYLFYFFMNKIIIVIT